MTNSSSYVHLPVTYYAQKKTDRTSVQHCAYNLWPTETLDSQDAEIYQGIQVFADSPSHFITDRPDSSGPELKRSQRGRTQRRDKMRE